MFVSYLFWLPVVVSIYLCASVCISKQVWLFFFFFVCVGCVCLCQRTYVLLVEILFKYVPLSFGVCVCAFSPPFVCACECVNVCVFRHRAPVAEAPQTDSRPAWCAVDSSGIPMRGAAGLRGSGSKSIILPIAWAPRIKLA